MLLGQHQTTTQLATSGEHSKAKKTDILLGSDQNKQMLNFYLLDGQKTQLQMNANVVPCLLDV